MQSEVRTLESIAKAEYEVSATLTQLSSRAQDEQRQWMSSGNEASCTEQSTAGETTAGARRSNEKTHEMPTLPRVAAESL